jgi:hypothetical protein
MSVNAGTIAVDLALVDKFTGVMDKFKQGVSGGIGSFVSGLLPGIGMMAIGAKLGHDLFGGISEAGKNARDIRALNEDIKNFGSTLSSGEIEAGLAKIGEAVAKDADDLRQVFNNMRQVSGGQLGSQTILDMLPGMKAFEDRGIAMEQTSQAIALSLQGATRGMKQFGIQMAEGSSKKDVLDAWKKKFQEMAPLAEQNAQTFEGTADRIRIAYGDMWEGFGAGFNTAMDKINLDISAISAKLQESMKVIGGAAARILVQVTPAVEWVFKYAANEIEKIAIKIEGLTEAWDHVKNIVMMGIQALKISGKLLWIEISEEFVKYYNMLAGSKIGEYIGMKELEVVKQDTVWLQKQLSIMSGLIGSESAALIGIGAKTSLKLSNVGKGNDKGSTGPTDEEIEEEAYWEALAAAKEADMLATDALTKSTNEGAAAAKGMAASVDAMSEALGNAPKTKGGQKSADREEKRAAEDFVQAGKAKNRAERARERGDEAGYEKEIARSERYAQQGAKHEGRANPDLDEYKKGKGSKSEKSLDNADKTLGKIDTGLEKVGKRLDSIEKKVNAMAKSK